MNTTTLLERTVLSTIPIDYSWSFADKTTKDTSYITHGYYTYPAKFIPQLASRLIKEHSYENDIVIDPFMGSGTTIVEAVVNNRIGIGTDINDIAYLIAKVKTTPIEPAELLQEFNKIEFDLQSRLNEQYHLLPAEGSFFLKPHLKIVPQNNRIDYWFLPQQKEKLSIILTRILEIENNDIRDFFLVSFAQILKSCSIWLQKSVKPTRDQHKKTYEPLTLFLNQSRKMIKKHIEFDNLINQHGAAGAQHGAAGAQHGAAGAQHGAAGAQHGAAGAQHGAAGAQHGAAGAPKTKQNIDNYRVVQRGDSRNLPCENNKAALIVTSPPYVTSYEYADLHQLPSLWFGYLSELSEFRKKFIGSAYTDREKISKRATGADLSSSLAEEIVLRLGKSTRGSLNKKGREVKSYFADMLETFVEMKRVLKKGGRVCIVIGNTEFNGVKILNAEVFQEQFENIGFKTHDVIHREIPSKMLPSTRDNETGRFVKAYNKKEPSADTKAPAAPLEVKLAYPTEYILIMEKL